METEMERNDEAVVRGLKEYTIRHSMEQCMLVYPSTIGKLPHEIPSLELKHTSILFLARIP